MQNQTGANLPPRPSIRQAADYHGVDQKTIRRWIAQGRLTAQRIGPRLIRLWVVDAAAAVWLSEMEAFNVAQNLAAKRRKKKHEKRTAPPRQQRETKIMVGTNALPVMQPLSTTLEEMEETA